MFEDFEALEGCLPLIYRGIPMHLIDTDSEPGRRLAETYFPGVDGAAFDDFGKAVEMVSIRAIIVSDAYHAILRALRAAFEMAGPGLLVHPMLGPLSVIQGDIPQLSLASSELRVIRISASFKVVSNGLRGGFTGPLLSAASAAFGSSAAALVTSVGSTVLSMARIRAVSRSFRILARSLKATTKAAGRGQALAIDSLVAAAPTDVSDFDAQLAAIHSALADVRAVPAVAPAAGYVAPQDLPSAARLEIAAELAASLVAEAVAAPSDADHALLLGGAAYALQAAADLSAYVEFSSRGEATALRQRLLDGLSDLGAMLEPLSAGLFAGPAATLWDRTRDLAAALSSDLDEVIGRLPPAIMTSPGRPVNAWLVAMHYFGDDPGAVEAAYAEIVARNNPRHPAELSGDAIEILK